MEMIIIWGICTWGAGSYDQMTRWDLSCPFFTPERISMVEDIGKCCANCTHWHVYDKYFAKENDG